MFVIGSNSASTGYNLTRSLRFRSSASAYLNRTQGTPTNTYKFTLSCWLKRGLLTGFQEILGGGTSSSTTNYGGLYFDNSTNSLGYIDQPSGSAISSNITTAVFRDPSAWYHIVLSVDTTQATAANRVIIYVNNVSQTLTNTATYSQNTATFINTSGNLLSVGAVRYSAAYQNYLDGYLTEVNFIDGQALTPSSFGSTNALTGVWQPARYTGSYGTNGFYLPFTDNSALTTASNVGLGKDFSGNGNYWVTNNISITAGVTYDSMTDVPTLTSATAANFAVLNAVVPRTAALSGGNLALVGAGAWSFSPSSAGMTSGKYYCEIYVSTFANQIALGICKDSFNPNAFIGAASTGWVYYANDGGKYNNNVGAAYGATYGSATTIGIAFDADAGTLTFYKNNTSQGTAYTGLTSGPYYFAAGVFASGDAVFANFGQQPFTYTAPSGFVALNTYNLPTSTIVKGNTVMDATLYTGNATGQSVTNTAAFKPDLVWLKQRSAGTTFNLLYDSIRGATKYLSSNSTVAEGTVASSLTAFNSNGFTVGADPSGADNGWNASGASNVGWQWQAGQGSSSSNTNGTITSTVSVNASAGFSVVTYTGTGANATVGHGLGVAPTFIIVKSRSASGQDWRVYTATVGNTGVVTLNSDGAAVTGQSGFWNNTSPTSSVFSVGGSASTNGSGTTYVAYCWTPIAGYSAFGGYTGNGSTNGAFIYTGFRPRFVLVKQTDAVGNWIIWDTARSTYNQMQDYLVPNSSGAESNNVLVSIDALSNGFKCRTADDDINGSGNTYIYMAFAENPFKNALAR